MNALTTAIASGAAGAVTTNIAHEITRRVAPNAPRVDRLGMQALGRVIERAGGEAPPKRQLYGLTLAGDLLSNTGYFGLVGTLPRERRVLGGLALGTVAGIGAVLLPGPLGLKTKHTSRTAATSALTVALYAAGGLAAGITQRALRG